MEESQDEVCGGHDEPADLVARLRAKEEDWEGGGLMECLEVIINFSWHPGIER